MTLTRRWRVRVPQFGRGLVGTACLCVVAFPYLGSIFMDPSPNIRNNPQKESDRLPLALVRVLVRACHASDRFGGGFLSTSIPLSAGGSAHRPTRRLADAIRVVGQ